MKFDGSVWNRTWTDRADVLDSTLAAPNYTPPGPHNLGDIFDLDIINERYAMLMGMGTYWSGLRYATPTNDIAARVSGTGQPVNAPSIGGFTTQQLDTVQGLITNYWVTHEYPASGSPSQSPQPFGEAFMWANAGNASALTNEEIYRYGSAAPGSSGTGNGWDYTAEAAVERFAVSDCFYGSRSLELFVWSTTQEPQDDGSNKRFVIPGFPDGVTYSQRFSAEQTAARYGTIISAGSATGNDHHTGQNPPSIELVKSLQVPPTLQNINIVVTPTPVNGGSGYDGPVAYKPAEFYAVGTVIVTFDLSGGGDFNNDFSGDFD